LTWGVALTTLVTLPCDRVITLDLPVIAPCLECERLITYQQCWTRDPPFRTAQSRHAGASVGLIVLHSHQRLNWTKWAARLRWCVYVTWCVDQVQTTRSSSGTSEWVKCSVRSTFLTYLSAARGTGMEVDSQSPARTTKFVSLNRGQESLFE